MHQELQQLPVVFQAGDASIRSTIFEDMAVNLVQVPKGTDFGPLLEGLPGDRCQCPHWGYLLKGRIHVRYADTQETIEAGEVFYWQPGHTGWVDEDTSFVELSPAAAMKDLLAHFQAKVPQAKAAK
jgi:hypothetical protein